MSNQFPNPPGWFDLPYEYCACEGLSIGPFDTGSALYAAEAGDSGIWMATSWQCVAELLSQVEFAHGRVLCTGLGLGIVPLLIAERSEVKSVTVLENDNRVIRLFMRQGFDLSKITIVEADAMTYRGGPFDCLMLDHYNGYYKLGFDFMVKSIATMRENTSSSDAISVPFRWTEMACITDDKLGLPIMTPQQRERYVGSYKQALDALDSTVAALKRIDARRC